jgi:predicted esterase YcpF (UPF0227 family)
MEQIVIYFHGFGSSPATEKVSKMRAAGLNAYAFPIDVDPRKSMPALIENINDLLVDYVNHRIDIDQIIFVGTSLGAWYAERLARLYGVTAYLINPSYNPAESLGNYGVSENITDSYAKFGTFKFVPTNKHYISTKDEVVDHIKFSRELDDVQTKYFSADHRFNGPEFDYLIQDILCSAKN